MQLTNLEICRKVADIENIHYMETKYKENNFLALISENDLSGTPPEIIGEYNPLNDDAMCFKFCYNDDIQIHYVECPAGSGKAYFANKGNQSTDYQSTPNMAVCLAKIGIFADKNQQPEFYKLNP